MRKVSGSETEVGEESEECIIQADGREGSDLGRGHRQLGSVLGMTPPPRLRDLPRLEIVTPATTSIRGASVRTATRSVEIVTY